MPRMNRTIALALVLFACGKGDKEKPAEPATKTVVEPKEAPPPPKKAETTAAAFGKTVGPFGKIAKLTLGMSEADAKAAATDLEDADNALEYALEFAQGRLVRINVKSTALQNLENIVAEAWGPGTVGKNVLGGDQMYWFSPATHTRARADSSDLELAQYLPLEELLGTDKVMLGGLPKPVWGVSLDDIKRDYPNMVDEDVKHVILPPAEWDREDVQVFLLYSERKKTVDSASFEIADGPDQATTLAAFEKKWGKPKLLKSYGAKDDTMVFHSKNPLIEVSRSVQGKSWEVRIRAKDDACGGPCYKGL